MSDALRMRAVAELGFEQGFLKQATTLGIPLGMAKAAFEKLSGKKAEPAEKPKAKKKPAPKAKAPTPEPPVAAPPGPSQGPPPGMGAGPPPGLGGGGGVGMPQLSPAEMMILAQLQRNGAI